MIGEISTVEAGFLMGLTIGIVEVLKRLFPWWSWSRLGPVVALFVGLALAWGVHISAAGWNGDGFRATVIGCAIGLSATGLYDGVDRLVNLQKHGGDDGDGTGSRRP